MEIETRQAALCILRRKDSFLVAELTDPHSGRVFHRPPGGGIEEGEAPEQTVRRELLEELGIQLTHLEPLGFLDHIWLHKGRKTIERAWFFLASCSDDDRLSRGETPEILEADGERHTTVWRPFRAADELPPICPENLGEILSLIG